MTTFSTYTLTIVAILSATELLAQQIPVPSHLSNSTESAYLPMQSHTERYCASIKRNVLSADKNDYVVHIYQLNQQGNLYQVYRSFTFSSSSQYTKAWLTRDVLLLTNNGSEQLSPSIGIYHLGGVAWHEYNAKKDATGLIRVAEVSIRVNTTAGCFKQQSNQWHELELDVYEDRVSIPLFSFNDSRLIHWTYYISDKKGVSNTGQDLFSHRILKLGKVAK